MHKYVLLLHVLAATIWTGGHIVLALAVLPLPALVIQALTGLWLAHRLAPDARAWFAADNFVTRLIVLKLCLLAATVLIAVDTRLRVIPRLSPENLTVMARRIRLVTLLAIVFAVLGVTFRTGPWP